MRFGVLINQDAAIPELIERFRTCERAGLDAAYVADHTQDYRTPTGPWFDGWTVLAAVAQATTSIRIGTLVSNPVLRAPVLLAKEAHALDHLSGGRLELGIGTGIAGFDHEAMGIDYWDRRERVERFAEYVAIVDTVLRSDREPVDFDGRYYRTQGAFVDPPTVQRPRPPITIGGQSPTVLRVAAERADCWNTHGPFDRTVDEILTVTRDQSSKLDELSGGRTIRRSLLAFAALDVWRAPGAFEDVVTRFAQIGFTEFVVGWPQDGERRALFDRTVADLIPRLRAG